MAQGFDAKILSIEYTSEGQKFVIAGGITSGLTLSASTSNYLGLADYTSDTTEANTQADLNIPTYNPVISYPWIYISANATTATSNWRVRKNGISNITVPIAAGTTGEFEDTTSTFESTATDSLNYRMDVGSGGSITIRNFSLLVDLNIPTVHIKGASLLGCSIL